MIPSLSDGTHEDAVRSPAGHARAADSEGRGRWAQTRLRHRRTPAADVRGRAARRRERAVSGTPTPAAPRLGQVRMGRVGEQPTRPLLRPHGRGPQAADSRRAAVRSHDSRGAASAALDLRDALGMWWRRLAYLLRRSRAEHELREEIEMHRRFRQSHLETDGATPADARPRSLDALGNVTLAREDSRGVWIPVSLQQLTQDLRYALRCLPRSPGFSLATTSMLTIGIGFRSEE